MGKVVFIKFLRYIFCRLAGNLNRLPGRSGGGCWWLTGAVLLLWFPVKAQSVSGFVFYDSVGVYKNNAVLSNPWTGGLNSPQFSTIDLNGDGRIDLVVFDRTTGKVSTFLNRSNSYLYAPDYEILFPRMESWCLLADYNGDGKKDLFTATDFGVKVMQNVTPAGGLLAWKTAKEYLLTKGFSGSMINLKVDRSDIPALTDVDNDGDLDILTFAPVSGANIEYHRNLSREKYGHADSLEFEKADARWGSIEECGQCNDYLFGNSYCRTEKMMHAGSSLLALDLDGDNDKDLLVGDVSCSNISSFINRGTPKDAVFNSFTVAFPAAAPINIGVFPAVYYEDVDFDGIKDLLAAPNTAVNEGNLQDFVRSAWFYRNTGTNSVPDFRLVQKDFLQSGMIEVGEYARPAFADVDADGDADLLVSNRGQKDTNGVFRSSITLYENTGTQQQPVFRLTNENYANLASLNLLNLRISFADLNNDKVPDLVFSATAANTASIYYILNKAAVQKSFDLDVNSVQKLNLTVSPADEPLFYDLDADLDADLLLGRAQGGLAHYENTGNFMFVLRSPAAGGIADNDSKRNLSLAIGDLDNNGKADLVTGDQSGALTVYHNFTDRLNDKLTGRTDLVFNKVRGGLSSPHFGREVFPAVYNTDLVLGTYGGGLVYLKDQSTISGLEDELLPLSLEIFPNPASGAVTIRSREKGQVVVYTLTGQQVIGQTPVLPFREEILSVEKLPAGIYMVEFRADKGGSVVKKMVVW